MKTRFLLLACLILAYCTPKEPKNNLPTQSAIAQVPTKRVAVGKQRVAYPKADSAGKVFYGLAYHTPSELAKIKQQELTDWQKSLQTTYQIPFKTKYFSKYFDIAYRCTDAQASALEWVTNVFFQDIYARHFRYEPLHPFKIVYFVDKTEFTKYTKSTAYGFYQPATKTLFTYTNSGEGTLWHELMHAFVDANIEHNIQQWFSEGFASFYEMGGINQNKFVEGYTNWRLPLLQKMFQNKAYLPLPAFMEEEDMTEENAYAKARFIFCYLWIYDKMDEFAQKYLYELSAQSQGETLGKKAVAEIERLVGKDMDAIEKEYKAWAMKFLPHQKLQKLPK